MGRTGSCYGNARMESFFATLKKELIYKLPVYRLTYEEVLALVFEWIEGYYNLRRRHTSPKRYLAPSVGQTKAFTDEKGGIIVLHSRTADL